MGQIVYYDRLKIYGTTFTTTLKLKKDTPAGNYDITIIGLNGNKWTSKVIIQ